ncbi:Alpha-1,3-mannosyltransferase-like protein [Elasticomyces elasticus]|nr:Alpha-1,3-mannosyltransferase-like protein [Elasticomyces elasticus]
MAGRAKNIVFFHPDLGIGGAERLIVDAAVGLQELGHKVTIYTSHCDRSHCFDEVKDALFSDELLQIQPDVFIVDQLSACIPLLRWLYPKQKRTLFYCHFPDQLLAKGRDNTAKKIYRAPFDWFEEWSISASDKIVVNSKFTRKISKSVFKDLAQEREFGVIHPCVSADGLSRARLQGRDALWQGKYNILLSINRFETKKDIALAIRAYRELAEQERKATRLVLAGGYDPRVLENVEYHKQLEAMAEDAGLKHATVKTVPTALALPEDIQVIFLLSVPEEFKISLLRSATLLLYTPQNEHFGIVPVEAMKYALPVLASNTGGPLETIIEGDTGYLRDVKKPEEWTKIIREVIGMTDAQRKAMGEKARARVKADFTRDIMAQRFDAEINDMLHSKRPPFLDRQSVVIAIGLVGAFTAALLAVVMRRLFTMDPRTTEFVRVDRSVKSGREFTLPVAGA